jgi:hypothetical protein
LDSLGFLKAGRHARTAIRKQNARSDSKQNATFETGWSFEKAHQAATNSFRRKRPDLAVQLVDAAPMNNRFIFWSKVWGGSKQPDRVLSSLKHLIIAEIFSSQHYNFIRLPH